MALRAPSLFLYGYQITQNNSSIDFKTSPTDTTRLASIDIGYYSLTELLDAIVTAMELVDPVNTYTATADRTIAGGTQNRITISTSGSHLDLLFGSGPRAASTIAPLIGFASSDQTGATSYTGSTTSGTRLLTDREGFNYVGPDFYQQVFGQVNVSSAGYKEAVVYSVQQFWQVQFKYIKDVDRPAWSALFNWMMQQRPIDFTPEITSPSTFYSGTLESTAADGNGIAFQMVEMLGDGLQFYWDTDILKFRKDPTT